MVQNKKLQVWLPLLFSIVLIMGMILGYKMGNRGISSTTMSGASSSSLQDVMTLVKRKYVDGINVDSLEVNAINSIMNQLDPHSVYFPPVEVKEVNEDLSGNFEGIGIEFNVYDDTTNVLYVIPQGPSDKAGLTIGDKILAVNDSAITGPSITFAKIKERIKGAGGTVARLKVLRNGNVLTINVTRGNIPLASLDASYMINSNTGYIKLSKFSETTYEEFMKALEDLKAKNMTSLILDLRGNGGGFMNEATDIADEFLSGDKLIVYTEGVHSKKKEYTCKRPGLFETGKLAVLIDDFTASASEVLAGSLQDWDRATIIGRRSFGKGLVQDQYPLDNGGAIRLTIARYFTPLGRSIQRPYDKGKKIYMEDIMHRYINGEAYIADSNKIQHGKVFTTPQGKKLYGGGGIMPDIFIASDTTAYTRNVYNVLESGTINRYAYMYYLQNRTTIDAYKNADQFTQLYDPGKNMWTGFVEYAKKDSVDITKISAIQKEFVQNRLKAQLAKFRWRNTGLYEVLNSKDAVLIQAMNALSKPATKP